MLFLLFLHDDRRIRIQEAQKHMDPVDLDPDPDPQYYQELINICEGVCAGLGVEQHALLGEPLHPRQCSQGGQGVTRPGSDHNDR